METIEIIKRLQKKDIPFFTLTDFARLFKIDNQQTLYKKIQRLAKKEIIKKIINGKYLFLLKELNKFTLANFLYQPSYLSLESALSFYSIITGFPYQITSITPKKTKLYTFDQKTFSYTQIKSDYFWGWEKEENFLIADREKALLDYLYFVFKGLRNFDKEEFDFQEINKKKLTFYIKKFKSKSFTKFVRRLKI